MEGKDTVANVVEAEQGTLSPSTNVEGKSTVDTKTGELVWQPQEVSTMIRVSASSTLSSPL